MQQDIQQLELGLRVKALADAVVSTRASKDALVRQEAEYLDLLARAEAEVLGKGPGSAGVELSGLVTDNPYAPQASESHAKRGT
jgi:hypothetical protein